MGTAFDTLPKAARAVLSGVAISPLRRRLFYAKAVLYNPSFCGIYRFILFHVKQWLYKALCYDKLSYIIIAKKQETGICIWMQTKLS